MLKVGGGVRGMLKYGTMPFPVHTVLNDRQHIAHRGCFGSTWIKAGKWFTGRWVCTWPHGRHGAFGNEVWGKGTMCLFFNKIPLYGHLARPCHLHHAGHSPGIASAKGGA